MNRTEIVIFLLCVKGIAIFCKGTGQVGLPPVITSEFESEYFFPPVHSTALSLHCQAENGNITYEWYKSFMKLKDNQRVTSYCNTGEIFFSNLTAEDFGMYYCLAKNQFGASISAFFKISETSIDSFPFKNERNETCQEFHHCKLSCSNKPICVPTNNCRIEWKNGPGTLNNVDISENMTLDREGNLHFLNINRSYGAKDYYCGVWNDNEQIFRKGNLLNLFVQDSADSFVPLRAVYHSGYTAYPGENATLQCIFSGNPVLEVSWQTRNGSHIVENHKYSIRHGGKELHIKNTTFKDDEVYKCVSNDNIQNPYLNVTSYPLFPSVHKRFMMKMVKFTINRSTKIMCNAISAPDEMEPVVIMWMKNGKQLNQESRYQLSDDKKKLHIYKTKLDDAGCYTCVVENSEGIAVANFLLHDNNTVPSPDQTPSRPLIIKKLLIFGTVALFLLIASIISTKKIRQITKNKQRLRIEGEGEGRFSGATVNVYSEPDQENQDHLHVERVNDLNTSSERDLWSEVVDAENIYDILGDCSALVADSSELSSYDCMKNIQGIYNTSFRANVQTFKEAFNRPETMGQREGVEISGNSFPMMTGENISESRNCADSKEHYEINFIEKDLFDDESNDTIKVATSETNNKADDALDITDGISSQNSELYDCN